MYCLPFLLPQFQLLEYRIKPVQKTHHKTMETIAVPFSFDIEPIKIMGEPIQELEPAKGIRGYFLQWDMLGLAVRIVVCFADPL